MIDLVEYFLAKNAGGGGSDITVEALNVTENGTYTADEGKAYSPVTVNVADISTAWVYVANFWRDPLVITKGTVDPLAQFIYTV